MFVDGYIDIIQCNTPDEVTKVRIGGWDLKSCIEKIKTFQNLETFESNWGGDWNEIPEILLKFPNLKRFSFSKNSLGCIPKKITAAKNLVYLNLASNVINTLPDYLSELTELEELDLSKNPVFEIDFDLRKLKKLRSLHLGSSKFKTLPQTLLDVIPQLSELWLDKKSAGDLKRHHPDLYKKLPFISLNQAEEGKLLKKVLAIFHEQQTDWEKRAFVLNLLSNNKEKIQAQISHENLSYAFNFKGIEPIRLRALEIIGEQFSTEAKEALKKNAQLAVLGKLGINKNDLRQKLKDHNIKYSAKVDAKTTHILVGQNPGEELEKAFEKGLYLLNEKNITDFWEEMEKPYMLDVAVENPDQLENLSMMLLSGQDDSAMVALSMFKQGGFPKALMTELFITYKILTPNTPVHREAERLLRQYGSAELIALLKFEQGLFHYQLNEATTTRYINRYEKNTELDGIKIARYVYQKFGSALNYLLKNLSETEAEAFAREKLLTSEGVISLDGMGLKSLPPAIYKLGAAVKKLNLSNNSFDKLPNYFKQFVNLESLDLRYNYSLKKNQTETKANLKEWLPNCKVLW